MEIYKTTNLINDKIYVGQTNNRNKYYIGGGAILQKAIKKYGKGNFIREPLCECSSQNELNEMETYWIEKLNSQNSEVGYNIDDGGQGHGLCSDETKRKISNALLGRSISKETRRKMSEAHRGKRFSSEHKNKIGKANHGMKRSKGSRQKMSESQIIRWKEYHGKV